MPQGARVSESICDAYTAKNMISDTHEPHLSTQREIGGGLRFEGLAAKRSTFPELSACAKVGQDGVR